MIRFISPVLLIALGLALYPLMAALAAEADIYWQGGTSSTGAPIFIPATVARPLPTVCN